jgi:hypothetical protein
MVDSIGHFPARMAVEMHNIALRLFWITSSYSDWRVKMRFKFDIFKRLRDGTSLWIVAVEGLEEARNRINRFAFVGPGDYLIYSEERCRIVEHVTV